MTTIYMLTSGCYSDYRVDGIYSAEELALKQKELLDWTGGDADIEEMELDELVGEAKGFHVAMFDNGDVDVVNPIIVNLVNGKPKHSVCNRFGARLMLSNNVVTEDETVAVKVTNELRARLIAQNLWYDGSEKITCTECKGTGLENKDKHCERCKGYGKVYRTN